MALLPATSWAFLLGSSFVHWYGNFQLLCTWKAKCAGVIRFPNSPLVLEKIDARSHDEAFLTQAYREGLVMWRACGTRLQGRNMFSSSMSLSSMILAYRSLLRLLLLADLMCSWVLCWLAGPFRNPAASGLWIKWRWIGVFDLYSASKIAFCEYLKKKKNTSPRLHILTCTRM